MRADSTRHVCGVRLRNRATITKRRRTAILIMMSLFAVSACSSGSDDGSQGEDDFAAGGGEGPRESAHVVVAVPNLGGENWALHTSGGTESNVHNLIGDTLLQVDPETREHLPGLVETWELSDDLLTWTFTLRPDVPFHDGYGTLTAEDVRFTWELMLREDAVHSRAASWRSAVDGDINNFEIINDLEFRIHTPTPIVTLPDFLHAGKESVVIASKAYWEDVGEEQASRHPIGTGPFKFVSHEPGVSVTVEAVEDHWRQTPEFDTLELRIISEEATRLAQVRTGDVYLAPIDPALIPEAEAAGVRIVNVPDTGLSNVYFGGMFEGHQGGFDRDAPWVQADNPERGRAIREALSVAIDRQSIVDNILLGGGAAAAAPLVFMPGDYAFTDPSWEVPEYSPDRARELLAEGGYPDGFEIDFPTFAQGGRPAAEDIAEAIAGMFEEIGITVNRRPTEFSPTFRELMVDRTTAGMVYQFTQSFADEPVERFLGGHTPEGTAVQFYHPAITEAIPRMLSEPDYDQRMAIAREAAEALIEDVAAIGVVSMSQPYIMSEQVADWRFIYGTTEIKNLEYITLVD